jgi:hypothetical protein
VNTRRLDNLAVYEIPEILDDILATAAPAAPRAAHPVKVQLTGGFMDVNSAY